MARRGDTRSPSPAGSYSSSRRRDDDHHAREKRDDRGHTRRRSRSPNQDRRYRDRDAYRGSDRGLDIRSDRRYDDSYRSGRRVRSRERYRSLERLNGRDRRQRSRERDDRVRRGDSRESSRRQRNASPDSKHKDGREMAKDGTLGKTKEASKPTTSTKQSEEEMKKAERLAKLEAWKQKQAAERERKQKEVEASRGTRALLNEMDKKSLPSTVTSPRSPATPLDPGGIAPYTGKFDPKLVAKKAATNAATSGALGGDIPFLKSVKASATLDSAVSGSAANLKKGTPSTSIPSKSSPGMLKASGNVSGFGFGRQALGDAIKAPSKAGVNFGDEESSRKKLEKLPTPPPEENTSHGDAALANGVEENDDDDDDAEMEDAGTEEEAAAAARAAAEKREERLLAQSHEHNAQDATFVEDVDMQDVPTGSAQEKSAEEEDEEDVDPLDAFMFGLDDSSTAPRAPGLSVATTSKTKQQEPEAMFSDDDDEFTTMEANPDDILDMASKSRKKKEIPTVNHAKVDYESFRKSFYTEPTELADMSEAELADLRLELEGIVVRGVDVPKPVQKWSQCALGVQSLEVVQKLGYEKPTAIQSQAIPAIMSGRDVIGIAKTGSGKTMAFLLPMFRHIKDQRPLESMDGPVGLIMTPTRELATQIHKECKPWLKALGLRAVCAYGGAPIKDQIADLKRGAEIIVCTPGRTIDLLAANSGRVTNLRRVTYVVLDEADRMFDMGFEPQVMKVLINVRPNKQTVLFSATFPRNMEALARKTLVKPVEIVVGGRSKVAPEIKQVVEVRAENTKFVRLLQLLGEIHEDEDARSLVFVDRQESAEELMNAILRKGYPCFTIHGGKDQYDRDSVISDFKAGVFPVLVATSVAARGLDVKQLKMVVNFDCPNHLEDYVHRAGRTGRAGNTGLAVTFITEDQERYAVDIAKALRQSEQPVPEDLQKLVDGFQEKVKAGKEKMSGSGFGGKGLERLDQERDAQKTRERKTYKTGDDNEEEEKEKEKEEKIPEVVVKPAGTSSAPLVGVPEGIDLDGLVKVHKTEVVSTAANPLDRMKGVNAAVDAINARLRKTGDIRGNAPIDNKGPDAGAFHATIEINDFPQKARWGVTNRTNVAKILEATGTSITTKGNFYAAGSVPGPNDAPKLYILVEGDTEVVVQNACRELMRLLKEGTMAAADSDARAPASGRYSVL